MVLLLCYEARIIPSEFAETKWITAAMVSSLEIHIIAPLVVILVWDQLAAKNLIVAFALFFDSMSLLLMMFLPKMLSLHYEAHDDRSIRLEDQLFNLRLEVRDIKSTKRVNTKMVPKLSSMDKIGLSEAGGKGSDLLAEKRSSDGATAPEKGLSTGAGSSRVCGEKGTPSNESASAERKPIKRTLPLRHYGVPQRHVSQQHRRHHSVAHV